ncbi:MAG: hypothetical protein LBR49_04975 [Tannerella sp.]|jgi:hypothetical protein|nr:hypothetical protein [Tannerella sp.]
MSRTDTTHKSKKKRKGRSTLLYILSGGILKEEFVVRHVGLIVFVVFLLFCFILNRYACFSKLRKIDQLQQELRDVKYEHTAVSGQLTGSNRISQVEELVKRNGLDLESAKTPPYILHR